MLTMNNFIKVKVKLNKKPIEFLIFFLNKFKFLNYNINIDLSHNYYDMSIQTFNKFENRQEVT